MPGILEIRLAPELFEKYNFNSSFDLILFDRINLNQFWTIIFDQERYETGNFQKLVYANFTKLFRLNEEMSSDHNCLVLNASEKIEVLHDTIKKHVLDMYVRQSDASSPIGTLWN